MSKIYTKKGDEGKTTDYHHDGKRIPKCAPIFDVLGNIEELTAFLGVAKEYISIHLHSDIYNQIESIQNVLVEISFFVSTLCIPDKRGKSLDLPIVDLENGIDALERETFTGLHLVLPSGGLASTHIHVARALCRRLERSIVQYALDTMGPMYLKREGLPSILQYINRLGDYLLMVAKYTATSSQIFYGA